MRTPRIASNIVIEKLLTYKDYILLPDGKILSKQNSIWTQISEELDKTKSAATLYSFVCDNKFNVRDLLNGKPFTKIQDRSKNELLNDSSFLDTSDTLGPPNLKEVKMIEMAMPIQVQY